MGLDERATLTNMAVEAGGFTGIIEADEVVVNYLVAQRGLRAEDVRKRIVRADPGATYCASFTIDPAAIVSRDSSTTRRAMPTGRAVVWARWPISSGATVRARSPIRTATRGRSPVTRKT